MHAGLLDVFHDAADEDGFTIGQAVHVDFGGVVQEAVQQHRRIVADLDRFAHVALQVLLLVHDFHRAAAQHVARAHHQRVADLGGVGQRFVLGAGRAVGRLAQAEFVQQLLEALAVLGHVDGLGAGADDGHAIGFQRARQLQRVWPPYWTIMPTGFSLCTISSTSSSVSGSKYRRSEVS